MIPVGAQRVVTFRLFDTSANTWKTGDAANLTLRVITDGVAAVPTNSASEVGGGVYKITLTAAEMNGGFIGLAGKSSTLNVIVVPVFIVTDQVSKNTSLVALFSAWDAANNVYKTGDDGNFTINVALDGTAAAATNAPAEVDATNAPGIYKITLTAAETNGALVVVYGTSSTDSINIMPTDFSPDPGPDLPDEGLVVEDTVYDYGDKTGTYKEVPASQAAYGYLFGANGNQYEGTLQSQFSLRETDLVRINEIHAVEVDP